MSTTRSGRSVSRKNSLISAPKPGAAGRKSSAGPSTRRPLKGRISRDSSVESDASQVSRTRRKGKSALAQRSALAAVSEDPDVEEPNTSRKSGQGPENVPTVLPPAPKLVSRKRDERARKLPANALRLKALKAQRMQGHALVPAAIPHQDRSASNVGSEISPDPVEANFEVPPSSSLAQLGQDPSVSFDLVKEVCGTIDKQSRLSNKENVDHSKRANAFIDPQNNAQKIHWTEHSQENPSGTKAPRNKRARQDESEDDEDTFETMRPTVPDRHRKQLHSKIGRHVPERPLSKRPRSEISESIQSTPDATDHSMDSAPTNDPDEAAHDSDNAIATSTPPLSSFRRAPTSFQRPLSSSSSTTTQASRPPLTKTQTQRHHPHPQPAPAPSSSSTSSSLLSPHPPSSAAANLARVRAAARQTVAQHQPRRVVQSRSAYSQAEEDRFLELIMEHGPRYSRIKKEDEEHVDGPLLGERTQVHLKDKAQELKFQFLKAGAPLPYNFDRVPLRKRMVDHLEGLGIFEGV